MSNSQPPPHLRTLYKQLSWSPMDTDKDIHIQAGGGIRQPPRLRQLHKQRSWSPDTEKEEVWLRRKSNYGSNKSNVTDEDIDELKACIELGFGFEPDSPDLDPKLSEALPALKFYCAVNKEYSNSLSRSSSSSSILSDSDSASSSIFDPGDDPETVKMRLKQWARVVAYSVRQGSGEPNC